jgi:hypothetical protein
MNSKPTIDIINIVDHDDGTASIEMDISDEFIAFYLEATGREEFVEEEFQEFFIEALKHSLETEDV